MTIAEFSPEKRADISHRVAKSMDSGVKPQQENVPYPLELAIEHYRLTMVHSAIRAWETKENAYANGAPDNLMQKRLKVALDDNATFTGRNGFMMIGWPNGLDKDGKPVSSNRPNIVTSIDAYEGEKEIIKDGADAEVVVLRGEYNPARFIEGNPVVKSSVAIDIVECTTNLSQDVPRSMSIMAGIVDGEIISPAPEKDWRYTEVWVANPNLVGYVSSDNTVTQNILNTMSKYGLDDSKKVIIRILGGPKRSRNQSIIDEALAAGATVDQLPHGDMATMIHTIITDGPYINLGSGGSPEARLVAALARARKAQYEARNVAVDEKGSVIKTGEVFRAEDVVKGDPDRIFLTAAAINGEEYLGMAPIFGTFIPNDANFDESSNGEACWNVDTLTITSKHIFRFEMNASAA